MFDSLLTDTTSSIDVQGVFVCMVVSMVLGILVARIHMVRNVYTKNFVVTLAVLPILVQSVIMLVNGNLGTGVAILGAFSLIRFRSVPGGARDISSVFWSMGVGLATGMGYAIYSVIFSVVVAVFLYGLYTLPFVNRQAVAERELKITIPEDLDYPGLFDDIFEKFTYSNQLQSVRTTTMGSLYELRYTLLLKNAHDEKELIDAVRVRNGNLPVVLGKLATNRDEL